jgi:plastocyanin
MNTRLLGRTSARGFLLAALLCLGGLTACGQSNTGNMTVDMTSPAQDMTSPQDLASPPDMATPNTFNGCDTAQFQDRTAAGAMRTVTFGGGLGNAYSPKCILIAAGQSVTFSGSFAGHPLRPGVGANATAGSANNPITSTSAGTTAMFTFPAAGTYPYNCVLHDGGGMNGVVRVQ